VSLLIRRITLAVLSLALVGAAFTLPAAAKKDPVASASKCKKKKKGSKASTAKKRKKRGCGSGSGGARGESTLPGVPTPPNPQQPASPPAPPATPGVSALTVTDNPVLGGRDTDAHVTISPAAPSGGQQVDLSSSDSSRASVPSAVQVAAGQTSANFTINTTAGPTTAPNISASIGASSQSVALNVVDKPSIVGLNLDHNCFPNGQTNYGASTVTLDVAAPVNESVSVTSDASADLNPFASPITVPQGSKVGVFSVNTMNPNPLVTVTGTPAVAGALNGSASDTASVRSSTASKVGGVSVSPDHVTVGSPSTGTVALSCEAPSGGQLVNLHSDNPDMTFASSGTVNATVTVPQDSLTATFQINTAAIGTANISATTDGSDSHSAVLTVEGLGT
jgi:hypothetical protein